MNKPLFLDTSYILALLNTYDALHSQAQELAERINCKLITTEAILTEIGNAFSKIKWRSLAISTLNDLRNDNDVKIVPVNSDLFTEGFELYSSRKDKEWGITDCISFVVMKKKRLTDALTSDHHFEQAGFRVLLK